MRRSLISLLLVLEGFTAAVAQSVPDKLVILTWDEYLSPKVIQAFEQQYGIKVHQVYYESEGHRDVQLSQGAHQYDLTLISEPYIQQYYNQGWLQPFQAAELKIADSIDPAFSLHDYRAIPYAWGTTGIAYREDKIEKGSIVSWMDIFQPKQAWQGRILMMDDPMELFGAALLGSSYRVDEYYTPNALPDAYQLLQKQRPHVDYGTYVLYEANQFVKGQYWIMQTYSGDAMYMQQHYQFPVQYVIPKEGCAIWVDYWVLMKSATHVKEAHQFINFIHQPQNAAENMRYTYFPSVNKDSQQYLSEKLRNNPLVFASDKQLSRCQHYELPHPEQRRWINQRYFKLRTNKP